jgi:hypothetical protein
LRYADTVGGNKERWRMQNVVSSLSW